MDPKKYEEGIAYLKQVSPQLSRLIARYGDCNREHGGDPFVVLCRSIISQQLSAKAARVLEERFQGRFGGAPTPLQVLEAPVEELRSLGLSWQKIAYLKDLAVCVDAGRLPLDKLEGMEDEAVIEALVQVKGIGRWTAEMFLIFGLGRPDVWAVDDLGLRKGVQNLLGLGGLPDKKAMAAIGEGWKPYRTAASFLLWRSLQNE